MKKVFLMLAEDPSFGAAGNLLNALYKNGHEMSAMFTRKDEKEFWKRIEIPKDQVVYLENQGYDTPVAGVSAPDEIIVVGASAWDMLFVSLNYDFSKKSAMPIKVILTDTYYVRNYQRLNEEFEKVGAKVYAMQDLMRYRVGLPTEIYYQPIEIDDIEVVKNQKFTICHSPGVKSKTNQKGTIQITETINRYIANNNNATYSLITDASYKECLLEKSKSHLFVDQLPPDNDYGYMGGVGKSGLEAMLLGSVVLTKGEIGNYNEETYPEAPIQVFQSEQELYKAIDFFQQNPEVLKFIAEVQQAWARNFINYEFVANHVSK